MSAVKAVAAAALLLLALAVPAAGIWVVAQDTDRLCMDLNLCTAKNYTWGHIPMHYDKEEACSLLTRKGVTTLHLYGDSFLRHVYIGLVLTLTGELPAMPEGFSNTAPSAFAQYLAQHTSATQWCQWALTLAV